MPDRPLWLDRVPSAIQRLSERAEDWVDRAALEVALGIGRRRAQQLLAHIPCRRVGASVVADRAEVIRYLQGVATGEDADYEKRRRKRLWAELGPPPVLVELSGAAVRQIAALDIEGLPEGVELGPGEIRVRFGDPEEALKKLMALAMAIGRNRVAFEERVRLV